MNIKVKNDNIKVMKYSGYLYTQKKKQTSPKCLMCAWKIGKIGKERPHVCFKV